MARARKPEEIDTKVKAFAKKANFDVQQEKREPKETDWVTIGFRVHPKIKYSVDKFMDEFGYAKSEFFRDIFVSGMRAKGIPVVEKPAKDEESAS
jgi:hypothetical protein